MVSQWGEHVEEGYYSMSIGFASAEIMATTDTIVDVNWIENELQDFTQMFNWQYDPKMGAALLIKFSCISDCNGVPKPLIH